MEYHERKSIATIIGSLLIFGIYYWTVFQRYGSLTLTTEEELQFWSKAILIAIPVSIGGKIVLYILFAILNTIVTREKMPKFEDERDKLIELKATRNAFFIFGMGFLVSMFVLAFGYSPYYMFLSLILAGVISEIFDNLSRLYFHRRGV